MPLLSLVNLLGLPLSGFRKGAPLEGLPRALGSLSSVALSSPGSTDCPLVRLLASAFPLGALSDKLIGGVLEISLSIEDISGGGVVLFNSFLSLCRELQA